MSEQTARIRIDGEPYLSRAKAYRDACFAHAVAWTEFAKGYGAIGYARSGSALTFRRGKTPAGWTKPRGQGEFSSPKRGHADAATLADFRREHPIPDARAVFGDDLCFDITYEGPDGRGSGMIGMLPWGPVIGWAGETYTAIIPDAEAAVRSHRERYPDSVVAEPAASWRLPAGLTRITKAEDALIYAQAAVAAEREASERGEAA